MKPIRFRFVAAMVAAAATFCSCASPKLYYVIEGPLNPNPSQAETDLEILPFFFTADCEDAFLAAEYDSLVMESPEKRVDGRVAGTVTSIRIPKRTTDGRFRGTLTIKTPDPNLDWVGIVGNFCDRQEGKWRVALPIKDLSDKELVIRQHAFDGWNRR